MPFLVPTDPLFLSRFYGWNRLEARSRLDEFDTGLAAATADPLWLLGRQWQLGELKGEDAGTPIHVEATYELAALDQISLGSDPAIPIDGIPVEVRVEREPVGWDLRMRVRAGQQFERLARLYTPSDAQAVIDQRGTDCPIALPPSDSDEWIAMDQATRRFLSLVAGHAIDGGALLDKLATGVFTVDPTLHDKFIAWYGRLFSQPSSAGTSLSGSAQPPAWNAERLDYDFRLSSQAPSAPGPLHAPSYRNGSVDWDAFTLENASSGGFVTQPTLSLTPTHATFGGQPMRRWWEFENAAVNVGTFDVSKTDLGKMVLMEFALIFGDDWFVVPLTTRPNTLVRVTSLQVWDCFGQRTPIPPARDLGGGALRQWQVFALAHEQRDGPSADFLYAPPVGVGHEESPVIEEVRFARDEDANAVFAIETTIANGLGEPVGGFAAQLESRRNRRVFEEELAAQAAASGSAIEGAAGSPSDEATGTSQAVPPAESSARIKFVLGTSVPENWIPFIPSDARVVQGLPERSVKLQRAAMVSLEPSDHRTVLLAKSRILGADGHGIDWVQEAAVGREGVRVELRRQRMRDARGETHVWLGRKIGVGKGEARSGLRFDLVESSR